MRISMDITPGYDKNGKEFLTMLLHKKVMFY